MMGGMMGGAGSVLGGGFGMITMALFWAALIIGVVFVIRWILTSTGPRSQGPGQGDSALEVLRRRYASGEVDRREFEEKKRDLL